MNYCIACGASVPEGRHVCPACERKITTSNEQEKFIVKPKEANTELSFGEEQGPNFQIYYYRTKPLNKFQIWMYKICFGVCAKNV